MSQQKVSRKDLLKSDDAFIQAAQDSAKWVQDHRRMVLGGITALLVVVGGAFGGAEYLSSRDSGYSEALRLALRIADAEVVTESETVKADPAATPPTYPSEADKTKALRTQLEATIAEAGTASAGLVARLYLGGLKVKDGDVEGAEQDYAAVVQALSAKDSFYFLAAERLAYVREQRGNVDGALDMWSRIAGVQDGFYQDYALLGQARLHQKKGDGDRARALLERLQKEFPKSTLGDEAKQRLAMLGAPATAKAAAPAPSAAP